MSGQAVEQPGQTKSPTRGLSDGLQNLLGALGALLFAGLVMVYFATQHGQTNGTSSTSTIVAKE